jgi:protein TonB
MKKQPVISKPETFEDIVFEDRNKSYGAYELNKKHRKYLIFAFFISLFGVSSAIAVPFIKAFAGERSDIILKTDVTAVLEPIRPIDEPSAPMPPAPPPSIIEQTVFAVPNIVEEAPPDAEMPSVGELMDIAVNDPIPDIIAVQADPNSDIIVPESEPVLFPTEPATFMNGDLEEFRNWVQENVVYPTIAIDNRVFGKVVIEFCVNANGKVVDIKVLRGVDNSLDNEAVRVISSSPLWGAPKQGGRPVKQKFVIPVIFKMD